MLRKNITADNAEIDEFAELQSVTDEMDLDARRKHFATIVCRDVSKHKLIDRERFTKCLPKSAGSFPGCIFAGVNKAGRPKRVYVKHCAKETIVGDKVDSKFDALMDYAAFKLIKCGRGRAPKVRVCASRQESGKFNHYLFSTDISHARRNHQDKIYYFSDLGDKAKVKFLEQNGRLSSREDLLPNPQPLSEDEVVFRRPGSSYDIDYPSTARLLVLGMILQLTDLHADNVGFVLSRNGNVVKAKLTFIDFFTLDRELPVSERTVSLKGMMHKHYNTQDAASVLIQLIEKISEEGFVTAFHEILKAGIENHCKVLKQEINAMDFVSDNKKEKFAARMKVIETNVEKLQSFVDAKYGNNNQSKKCVIC